MDLDSTPAVGGETWRPESGLDPSKSLTVQPREWFGWFLITKPDCPPSKNQMDCNASLVTISHSQCVHYESVTQLQATDKDQLVWYDRTKAPGGREKRKSISGEESHCITVRAFSRLSLSRVTSNGRAGRIRLNCKVVNISGKRWERVDERRHSDGDQIIWGRNS